MGQYYTTLLRDREGTNYVLNDQCSKFEKENDHEYYTGLKLMEHSWLGAWRTDVVSAKIHKNPMRVAWVGDYADTEEYKLVYETEHCNVEWDVPEKSFDYSGKWLVNHDKKTGFMFDGLAENLEGDTIYPVSLLAAQGNGRGGGDYCGADEELVGTWSMDLVSIEDELPEGYAEMPAPQFAEIF